MAYPVTLNGRTYTLADFEGTNYVDGLPDAFEDFVTHAGAIYKTTSTTSNTIGTGSKSFTTADNSLPYQEGTPLRISDGAAPATNWMDGIVTAYSGTSLTVNVVSYAGSGTKTDWDINIGGGGTSYTGTLPVAQGGTGATTAGAAATNLGLGTGDSPSFAGLTVDTDTLYVDSANNRVGIGTASPTSNLHLDGAEDRTGGLTLSAGGQNHTYFLSSDFVNVHNIETSSASAAHTWQTNSTERVRIDSSGTLLVGKTSGGNTNTVGFEVQSSGFVGICGDGIRPVQINRKTSDGDIIEFRKDGSTVGSIGSEGSGARLYINQGDTGIGMQSNIDSVIPVSANGGARNNAVDLGFSTVRWKNLYLSGGVYLGGTTSSNLLDDYEEGTWTPTSVTGSINSYSAAKYTKIGNTVHLHVAGIRLSDTTTASTIKIGGLPFATNNTSIGSMMIRYAGTTEGFCIYLATANLELVRTTNSGTWVYLKHSDLTSSSCDLHLSITYQTAA